MGKIPGFPCAPVLANRGLPTIFPNDIDYFTIASRQQEQIEALRAYIEDTFNSEIQHKIDQRFNQLMIAAAYDEPTETLRLAVRERS